ncbi:hypothetical protein [Pseudomaricurvus sp.]|uniref:hypothetical protein n=1 Tax=Pseudomaricurvus sp. TaxID=2004510 RepID=UPI003F6B9446
MKKLSVCALVAFAASVPFAGSALAGDQYGAQTGAAQSGTAQSNTGTMGGSQHKMSSDFKSFDKNGDSKISQDEAANNPISEYFVAIDRDSDQNITKEEFAAFTERYPSLVGGSEMEEAE